MGYQRVVSTQSNVALTQSFVHDGLLANHEALPTHSFLQVPLIFGASAWFAARNLSQLCLPDWSWQVQLLAESAATLAWLWSKVKFFYGSLLLLRSQHLTFHAECQNVQTALFHCCRSFATTDDDAWDGNHVPTLDADREASNVRSDSYPLYPRKEMLMYPHPIQDLKYSFDFRTARTSCDNRREQRLWGFARSSRALRSGCSAAHAFNRGPGWVCGFASTPSPMAQQLVPEKASFSMYYLAAWSCRFTRCYKHHFQPNPSLRTLFDFVIGPH